MASITNIPTALTSGGGFMGSGQSLPSGLHEQTILTATNPVQARRGLRF